MIVQRTAMIVNNQMQIVGLRKWAYPPDALPQILATPRPMTAPIPGRSHPTRRTDPKQTARRARFATNRKEGASSPSLGKVSPTRLQSRPCPRLPLSPPPASITAQRISIQGTCWPGWIFPTDSLLSPRASIPTVTRRVCWARASPTPTGTVSRRLRIRARVVALPSSL
jgi:hypothetical protein